MVTVRTGDFKIHSWQVYALKELGSLTNELVDLDHETAAARLVAIASNLQLFHQAELINAAAIEVVQGGKHGSI